MAEQDSSADLEPTATDEKLFKLDKYFQQYDSRTGSPNSTYTKTTTG